MSTTQLVKSDNHILPTAPFYDLLIFCTQVVNSGKKRGNLAGLTRPGSSLDDDLNITTQQGKTLKHLGFRNTAKPATKHIRKFRLRHTKQC